MISNNAYLHNTQTTQQSIWATSILMTTSITCFVNNVSHALQFANCICYFGKMNLTYISSKWNHAFRPYAQLRVNITRYHSNIHKKLKNHDQISRLSKSREDIASFVRFNRDFQAVSIDNYSDLFSKENNPEKSDHELEELRLRILQICAEYEKFLCTNKRVPASLSQDGMQIMLKCRTPEARQIFLIKSYFRDTVKIRGEVKKIVKRSLKLENQSLVDTSDFVPGCFTDKGKIRLFWWDFLF